MIVDSTFVESVEKGRKRLKEGESDKVKGEASQGEQSSERNEKQEETTESKPGKGGRGRYRDKEALWTKKRDKEVCGHKVAVGFDNNGLVLHVERRPANEHAVKHLREVCDKSVKRSGRKPSVVYVDKGYSSEDNRRYVRERLGAKDGIMVKGSRYKRLSDEERRLNKRLSKKRSKVERFFGWGKTHFGLGRSRWWTGKAVEWVLTLAGVLYNMCTIGSKLSYRWA